VRRHCLNDAAIITRAAFLRSVFGPIRGGFVCIATIAPGSRKLEEHYFSWPERLDDIVDFVESVEDSVNVYYCPQLLEDVNFRRSTDGKGPRVKENIKICTVAWADLDTCRPDQLLVEASIVVESSPGRYQALWILEEPQDPPIAEDVSRRIAYHHIPDGADRSGWDLTQLLRFPYTYNYKYNRSPRIGVVASNRTRYRMEDFRVYPETSRRTGGGIPMPEVEEFPQIQDPIDFMQERRKFLNSDVFRLFTDEPKEGSWSEPLWKLMMLLFEGGCSREEVFVVTKQAACNKYERDGRPDKHLWDDVCRAYIKHMEDIKAVVVPELEQVSLITPEEEARVRQHHTFIERYVQWATDLGDAAPQYHQAGAFVILSALLSGTVSLPTSFGNMIPNLWFMLLADTTLTRKSTSMDIATDLLIEVDPDAIMATDGSVEGLMEGLSTRPRRPSIFLRDEFTGLLEAMTRKDYLAGLAETFTKLYDGKFQKRMLRKDIIEIRDPILILFAGGIRAKTQQLLTFDHISSGFMPRFIFLTAESDVSRVRPLGPPITRDMTARENLLSEIRELYGYYTQVNNVSVDNTGISLGVPRKWFAKLSNEAWERYGIFEKALLDAGVKSDRPDLMTPVYARLGVSALKAAVLIAASEQREDEVIVEELHIIHAISYAAKWREYAIDIINGVGMTQGERELERVYNAIKRQPGISRSSLMQGYHLTARNADAVFQTLEQRGLITATKFGKGTTYSPVTVESE
jgi:hypothetical protein